MATWPFDSSSFGKAKGMPSGEAEENQGVGAEGKRIGQKGGQ